MGMRRTRPVLAVLFTLLTPACVGEQDKRFEPPSLATSGKPWTQPNAELPWAQDTGTDAAVGQDASGMPTYAEAGLDWPSWGLVPRLQLSFGDTRVDDGELHVERVDAYRGRGAPVPLLSAPTVVTQATGNRAYRPLADLPTDVQAIHTSGFFRSVDLGVDLPWDAVVLGDFSRSSEAILYLPDPPAAGASLAACVQLQTLGALPVVDDNDIWVRGGEGSRALVEQLLAERDGDGELAAETGVLYDLPRCAEPIRAYGTLTKLPTSPVMGSEAPCTPSCNPGQVCIDAVCATDPALRITARWDAFASDLEMTLELPGGERVGHRFETEGGLLDRVYSAGGALIELEGSAAGGVENIIAEAPVEGLYRVRVENSNIFGETTYLGSAAATTYQVDIATHGRVVETLTGTLPDADDAVSIEHVFRYPADR